MSLETARLNTSRMAASLLLRLARACAASLAAVLYCSQKVCLHDQNSLSLHPSLSTLFDGLQLKKVTMEVCAALLLCCSAPRRSVCSSEGKLGHTKQPLTHFLEEATDPVQSH